jgi:uncharacterized protein (TIGR02145 family)
VKPLCGTATYTETEFCQSPNVVKPFCGTETYTSTEFCQNGTVINKCGDTAEYTITEFCQDVTNAVLPLCGTATFTSTEFCQSPDVVKPLCGTATYSSTQMCHYDMVKNYFIDERDNNKYPYVTIGGKSWMAENLNYDVPDNITDVCYSNTASYCDTYGRLYNWNTAMAGSASSNANPSGVQGVCPSGWHLPSNAEWIALTTAVGTNPAPKLKANLALWNTNTGTDEFGFSALPGGSRNNSGSYIGRGSSGYWWSSTEGEASYAYSRSMDGSSADVFESYVNKTTYLSSVRCVKDSP